MKNCNIPTMTIQDQSRDVVYGENQGLLLKPRTRAMFPLEVLRKDKLPMQAQTLVSEEQWRALPERKRC